jgi:uncharacterized protein
MSELEMSLRSVDIDQRLITGIVAPYNSVSYMTPDPAGERIMRDAFTKSLKERSERIPLCRVHDHSRAVGMSREWVDGAGGLTATFHVRKSGHGDEVLEEARDGYLSGMSVGFMPVRQERAADGVREVREARLMEVSLVVIPAYDGARVLAVRQAEPVSELMAPFLNPPPRIDLSPIAAPWVYDAR